MALIEEFHVVADEYVVDSSVTNLIEGMWVMISNTGPSLGNAVIATGASGTRTIGVSGDTKSTSISGLPATNNSFIGATSTSTAFVNRVSDSFDETKASGKVTVYHSGGKFATNQYVTAPTLPYAPGLPLYVSAGGLATSDASANAQIVATLVTVPGPFASGVPGIDINGSITLGNYLEFKMEL